jgi:RHS repeat-associated protein
VRRDRVHARTGLALPKWRSSTLAVVCIELLFLSMAVSAQPAPRKPEGALGAPAPKGSGSRKLRQEPPGRGSDELRSLSSPRARELSTSHRIEVSRTAGGTSDRAALDVDGSSEITALTDGLLALRALFGFTGENLVAGLVDTTRCTLCTAAEVEAAIGELGSALDVDGNGQVQALSDGILVLRYLFGFRGTSLTAGAVDTASCARCTAAEISPAIEVLLRTLGILSCQAPDPLRGAIGGTVTLRGQEFFPGATTVTFGGVPATLLSQSATRVDAVVPAGASDGAVDITVGTQMVSCGAFDVNTSPTLDPVGDQVALLGQNLTLTISGFDPDGDALSYTVAPQPLPLGATFHPTTRTFSFSPSSDQVGDFPLTFTVSDGNLQDRESITLSVPPASSTTTLSGVVLTTGSAPLAGVRLVIGVVNPVETFSQADGTFFLADIPVAGRQRLLIDGSTVPDVPAGTYATVPEHIGLIEGADNQLQAPIFLLPLDVASGDPIDPGTISMITSSPIEVDGQMYPAVEMEVSPGSATVDGGGFYTGSVHISGIPDPTLGPMPLPDDLDLSVYIAVQPFGVSYDPPAKVAFPNVEGFPVGSVVDIFALDHDTGVMIDIGDAIVEAGGMVRSGTLNPDGTFTKRGVVRDNSWHGIAPPPPVPSSEKGDPQNNTGGGQPEMVCPGSAACALTGDFSEWHDTVTYRSMGEDRSLRFEYHSQHVLPHPFVARLWAPGSFTPPPLFMATFMEVAGIDAGYRIVHQPGPCGPGSCPPQRFARVLDASSFATGVYPASLRLSCQFPVSRRDATYRQLVQVVNERGSPFGSGWSLRGLERIHRTATGDLLLTDGRAQGTVYTPAVRARAEIRGATEQDFYRVAVSRGTTLTLRMDRRSSNPDGSGSLDPALELRDSRGFLLVSDDSSGLDTVEGPGSNAAIEGFAVPASDTYTVVARGTGGSRGPYTLYLTTASNTPLIEGRVDQPSGVEPAFVFSGDVAIPGELDRHVFAASVGTRISIVVDRVANQPDGSGSLDPRVELRTSNGILIAGDDNTGGDDPPGPGRNALVASFTLPATDTYEIVIAGTGGTTGPYRAEVIFGDFIGTVDAGDDAVEISNVVLSPLGEYSELELHEDDTFTRRMRDRTVKQFDPEGRLVSETDRNGNAWVYEYDLEGRLERLIDPVGLATTLRYDDAAVAGTCAGRLSEVEDPAGRVTSFVHDNGCNLIEIMDPDGAIRRFGYDERGLLTEQTSPRGSVTPEPDDFVTRYEYDFSGRHRRVTLPDGAERLLSPDQSIGIFSAPSCNGPSPSIGCVENPAPTPVRGQYNVVKVDAENRLSNLGTLDGEGQVTSQRDPLGRTTTYERDVNGNPTRIVEPSGHATRMTYDEKGRVTSVTDEVLGGTTLVTYDDELDLPLTVTDARGNTTIFGYDEAGNLLTVESPLGRTTSFSYELDGLLTTVTDPAGATTSFEYDAARNPIQQTVSADGVDRVTSFVNDTAGRVASTLDALSRLSELTYDDANRALQASLPGGRSIHFDYDEAGNLTSLAPPGRPAHEFGFDERGNLAVSTPPSVGAFDTSTTYSYNAEEQLTAVNSPGGDVLALGYDGAGDIESVSLPENVDTYQYQSSSGLLTQIANPDVTLDFSYDGSLLTTETWSGVVAGSVGRSYDVDGRLETQSVNGGYIATFSYDEDGLLVQAGDLVIDRDATTGGVAGTRLGDVTTEIIHNQFSEVDSDRASVAGSSLYSNAYTYDGLGRIARNVETIEGVATTFDYTYDDAGRLTTVKENGVATESYTYDSNGNRLTATDSSGSVSATYDDQDRLLTYGDLAFAYTEDGRLASRTDTSTGEVTTYAYDSLGALRRVDLPDGKVIEYAIDGVGRRVAKTVDGAVERRWLYADGLNPIAELDAFGVIETVFVYGARANVPDYFVTGGDVYRILADLRGSPRLVVDLSRSLVAQRVDYDAFGRPLGSTNPPRQPFGIAGGLYDPDTGLVRLGARDYDPLIGRWTTKDRLGFRGGSSNLYEYSHGDPVNLVDVTGFAPTGIDPAYRVALAIASLAVAGLLSGTLGLAISLAGVIVLSTMAMLALLRVILTGHGISEKEADNVENVGNLVSGVADCVTLQAECVLENLPIEQPTREPPADRAGRPSGSGSGGCDPSIQCCEAGTPEQPVQIPFG